MHSVLPIQQRCLAKYRADSLSFFFVSLIYDSYSEFVLTLLAVLTVDLDSSCDDFKSSSLLCQPWAEWHDR